jgi:hypothetical protein
MGEERRGAGRALVYDMLPRGVVDAIDLIVVIRCIKTAGCTPSTLLDSHWPRMLVTDAED